MGAFLWPSILWMAFVFAPQEMASDATVWRSTEAVEVWKIEGETADSGRPH